MWGSQGWGQWALQPAMFNDVPHEQIDWAELAKQWIQMQQTQPGDSVPPPAPAPPPPPAHGPSLPPEEIKERNNAPLLKTPPMVPDLYHPERPFEPEPVPSGHFWNKPQWESHNDVDHRMWNGPPVEPAAPIIGGKETFDYGHVHDNPPLAMQTIDYNHMSDYSYNPPMYTPPVPPPPPPVPESHFDHYWSQVNAAPAIAPIFLKKERPAAQIAPEEETTHIDAAKRKQLPAWIRDGLEKMEQERLKRLEKERSEKEQAEQASKIEKLRKDLNLGSPTFVPKSKFESDSEDEKTEVPSTKLKPIIKRAASPVEDNRTEEEKKQDLMLKVRRTLTEVLLSVTNAEMLAIAQEAYKKAKSKAPARQLASTTSQNFVAPALRGLASYDSGSEESEPEEEARDSSDSEEELYRKIKEKKKLFAVKEKKIIAELERKESEDKIDREKMNNGSTEKPNESVTPEKAESPKKDLSSDVKSPADSAEEIASSNDNPQPAEAAKKDLAEEKSQNVAAKPSKKESESDSSSSSESSSSETDKKKSYSKSKKDSKRDKGSSKRDHHKSSRHEKGRDDGSPDKHKRGRSPEYKSSSSKKRKKSKRSESSSSSSSASYKKKSSSHRSSNHSRRSRSREGRRRHDSPSPSKSHRSSHKSSHSHRYHDDKHSSRRREEKRHRDSRSPHGHSSKVPRKYRSSRSPSSETENFGKKSKKSRNR